MAENEDGQEKSEEPSEKKKADARKKGQTTRSRELTTFLMLLFAGAILAMMVGSIVDTLTTIMQSNFVLEKAEIFDPQAPILKFSQAINDVFWGLLPYFIVMVIVALVSPLLLGGWVFKLSVKPGKMNPFSGLKRMFGIQALMELLKTVLKFMLLGGMASLFLWQERFHLLGLGAEALEPALVHSMSLVFWQYILVTLSMLIIVAVDVPYQIWQQSKQLKMTRQEVKDEYKSTEGNPEIKGRIRQLQREMAQQRMMSEVPQADVVVTNPDHFAVALKYDENKAKAPIVIAKGADLIAFQIKAIAKKNNLKVLEIPSLARALYYNSELDREIPAGLYVAVAQVLAYVFQARKDTKMPLPDFSHLDIPDDLRRDT